VEEPTVDEPRWGRIEELRRLERCERGLAHAYRQRARAAPVYEAERLREAAEQHVWHADLLRRRMEALGGRGTEERDDDWIARALHCEDPLRAAERESIAVYHDHLGDFDPTTAELVRDRILADHERALTALDPDRDHQSEV